MGWLSRKPKTPQSDPIGEICRLMVGRPWEWICSETTEPDDKRRTPSLVHISGARVTWKMNGREEISAWWSPGRDSTYTEMAYYDAKRVFLAAQQHTASRVSQIRSDYDSVAKAMARAVLAGDRVATKQLADLVMELDGGTSSTE